MKKIVLLFILLLPLLSNAQAVHIDGPKYVCPDDPSFYRITILNECVCAVVVRTEGGVNCRDGSSSYQFLSPNLGGVGEGCDWAFDKDALLGPFGICWGEDGGTLCVTPQSCDGELMEEVCIEINIGEGCPTCDDGILNGDEYTIDCGGSCDDCDCEVTTLDIEGPNPLQICTTSGGANFTATAGLYDYEWSVSPGYPAAEVNSNTNTAYVDLNNPYNYAFFTVTVTARDCNGNFLLASSSLITIPCGGWLQEAEDLSTQAADSDFNMIRIVPNPAVQNQSLQIKGLNLHYERTSFELIDVSGRSVQSGFITNTDPVLQLKSSLGHGVYFIRFTAEDGKTSVEKVIVK